MVFYATTLDFEIVSWTWGEGENKLGGLYAYLSHSEMLLVGVDADLTIIPA